jgi:hypothetical protein
MRTILIGLLLASGSVASAAPEELAPGIAAPLPGKRPLPRRLDHLHLAMTGSLLLGDSTGVEGVGELRLWESLGVGLGFAAVGGGNGSEGELDDEMSSGSGSSLFLRLTGAGLSVNRWSFLGYADYHFDGYWTYGGAMNVPLGRNDYLRLSINTDFDGRSSFGIGLEHDVW